MSEEKRQPKTKEELNALKEEVETLNRKLVELNEDELIGASFHNPVEDLKVKFLFTGSAE